MQISKGTAIGATVLIIVLSAGLVYSIITSGSTSFLNMRVNASVLTSLSRDFKTLALKSAVDAGRIQLVPDIRTNSGAAGGYSGLVTIDRGSVSISGALRFSDDSISKSQVERLLAITPTPTYFILTAERYPPVSGYVRYRIKPFKSDNAEITFPEPIPLYLYSNPCPPARSFQ
jgi:hypothetical protein